MNFTNPIKTAAALASVTVFAVCAPAQDEAAAEKSAEQPAAEQAAAEDGDQAVQQAKTVDKFFYPLLRCKEFSGTVEVLRPREGKWLVAQAGRYYPLGSVVRVTGDGKTPPNAVFEFGDKSTLTIDDNAEFSTKEIQIGDLVRTLVLRKGRVNLALPLQLKEGMFKVVTPNISCENLAGNSWFDYSSSADGDTMVVRCVTGTMAVNGQHYKFPRLVAANQVRIDTTSSGLFSSITGESGDSKAVLDQGILAERNYDTGETVEVKKSLDFQLSPQCSIKILRAKSPVGGRTIVSMMTFNAQGMMKNRIAFAEGLSNVNSGELVVSTKVAEDDKGKKAAKNKLDEETETVEVNPAGEKKADAKAEEEKPDEEKPAKKEDKKTDDDDLI